MGQSGAARPVRIGVVGLGTVGSGVVRLLVESADHITRRDATTAQRVGKLRSRSHVGRRYVERD